ncbi:class I SAM-dependent methyltransferase [Variovorax sp. Sphag1AA]|uniref:class I SAM-dependent methyltransferase n=1 Tax=Variovorax sp. Sphag1AA TaxID=2587027 RepID=UPI00160891D2|nr:SAM-dependent methyltransferase [Variovorax sp. Sphag1AA]MBB3177127.1 SAM-dependent MidA family methyltransferase [Variovorax sp. Sphag1AA]
MNLEQGAQRANPLTRIIDAALQRDGGWLPFDRFMALALYAPGLGYYANASRKFGRMPSSGSDFVTAPELTPLFGRALAVQVAEALEKTGTDEVWEFGAGSGALALQLLDALGDRVARYRIVDLSGTLRERQQQTLAKHAAKVEWLSELPESMNGVVVGNEVLDAMPVQLLARSGGQWFERGVVAQGDGFAWSDRPTDLRPPVEIEGEHDYLTEIHPQAEAFIATLADRLGRGAAFFFDYGFPESEYYHPQRHMGTVMCHRGHQADGDPLSDVGEKDITAHVNFTGVALAGQNAGLEVLGYCNQARFLLNAGILPMMEQATLAERSMAARLIHEHEMGELFKVVGFAAGEPWDAIGFAEGDRSHTL